MKKPDPKTRPRKRTAAKATPAQKTTAVKKNSGIQKATVKKSLALKTATAKKAETKKIPTKAVRKKKATDPLLSRVQKVRDILDGKKGMNVTILRVTDVTSLTDYMVLCSGMNTPHLRALADEVAKQLRQETPPLAAHRRAGTGDSEWLVLDYLDFVVHLFTPSMRAYYALERLWKDAPVV
ncbi:MAG: ribosome silencing factor [Verrucomicrobiota bacterium]|jgi:ribosome-associated protein|nr:ribosome silencing factor [Verrucomicrobiota bacterium]